MMNLLRVGTAGLVSVPCVVTAVATIGVVIVTLRR